MSKIHYHLTTPGEYFHADRVFETKAEAQEAAEEWMETYHGDTIPYVAGARRNGWVEPCRLASCAPWQPSDTTPSNSIHRRVDK